MRNQDGTHIDDAREREWHPGEPGALSEEAPSESTGPLPVVGSGGVVGLGSAEAEALALTWLAAASERNRLAHECRDQGSLDEALPLENAANAYERCARELKQAVARASQRQPQPNK